MPRDRQKQKVAQQKHYVENKEKYAEAVKKKRRINREYIANVKANSKCLKCDENHPACLDFHHRENKEIGITKAALNWGLERLKVELAKCDILCSNCHRKHHFDTNLDYWKASRKLYVETN